MIILIGPSASGKTEIAKTLIKNFNYKKFVTTTTRSIRVGEINDIDYHFVSIGEFKNKIENDQFIEYTQYNGNYYGSTKDEISDDKIIILEPNGFLKFKSLNIKSMVSFFVECPKDVRKERMIERQDKEEDIKRRLNNDDFIFNNDIKKEADFVVTNDNSTSLKDLANKINKLYLEKINQ